MSEILDALNLLEKEKNISKEVLIEAIENSLLIACKNHFGTTDNMTVTMDHQTGEYHVYCGKTVVEEVTNPTEEISMMNPYTRDPILSLEML